MNSSLHRALTIHSTWAALPLFPVGELQDAALLTPFIDEVRSFLDQGLTSDEREYACLCSDFSQALKRHEDFQGPLAARLFAIGARHWLGGQNVKKPHPNTGILMSGRFWKSYSAECIRTFAPDRSLDWRSHVAAVSGYTKSLIKATWGNATTDYYCQHEERGDGYEVVMDSLGMMSLSPAAGRAMVFHEFMHGIKDSSDTFLRMCESARRGGYKGTEAELHAFFNQYEDIAVNVAGGSVLVDGLEDVRELYKGVFLINAYQLKKNYSIDGEFWVCSMARCLGESELPFTPSAEVEALIEKYKGVLDDLTGPLSLPISKQGLIRRDICMDPAKLAAFSRFRGEAEARLFFKLEEEFAGQKSTVQNLDSQPDLSQPRQSDKGQSQEQRVGKQRGAGGQGTREQNQEQGTKGDPNTTGQGKGEKQGHADQRAHTPGEEQRVPEKSGGQVHQGRSNAPSERVKSPVPQAKESDEKEADPAAQTEKPAGNGQGPNAKEKTAVDQRQEPGGQPSDPGGQKDATGSPDGGLNAQEKNAAQAKISGNQQSAQKETAARQGGLSNTPEEAPPGHGKESGSQGVGSGPQRGGASGGEGRGDQIPGGSGANGAGQEDQPGGTGGQSGAEKTVSAAGPDFSGLGEVGEGFELSEPLLVGPGPDAATTADPEGKFKALEKHIPGKSATREDSLQDGILGYGAPVDMSALREVQLEFAPVIQRGKRLFQGIRENAERAVQHRAKLVEEGDTFSISGMALRRSDPEHTLIFENPAQAIAVNHARFGMLLDMSGSTERDDRFKRLVEMAAVAALTIEDSGYQTSLGLFSSQGLLLYHAEYPKNEKLRRLGGLVKVVRHSHDLQTGGASVGLTRKLGFMGGTESEKAIGTFVEAITKTQSRNPGHFHGMIFTDGGLTERRLQSLITANPKLTWSVLCEGTVTQEAEDHFGKENTYSVQLDGDFIKTIFGAFSQSIKKFGSFQSVSKIRTHYQEALRDARRMPPEKAVNVIK
jgi:hypothetical protein